MRWQQALQLMGPASFIVVSLVVGTRLLLLARRTRQLPELALAAGLLCLGAFGYPLSIVARSGAITSPATAGVVLAGALASQNLAALAIYIMTWQVFRRERSWATALTFLAGAAFAASLVGHGVTVGYAGGRDGGLWYYLGFWARAGAYAWAAGEAFRSYGEGLRRLKLGLADAVSVDRVRLWGWAAAVSFAGHLVFFIGRLGGENVARSPFVLGGTSLAIVLYGVFLWLAFLPPAVYTRRVGARAPGL